MRHLKAGKKLGRNTSHRRALLRNLTTSVLVEERVETTVAKAKAVRPHVEKMISLGKKGDVSSRRLAASYLMTREAVDKLFNTIGPRMGDRTGGYTRVIRTGFAKGNGMEKAFLELIGSEKMLAEKQAQRAEARAKRREEARKQMEEAQGEAPAAGGEESGKEGGEEKK
jgi:large subunit ribosomal protein L17